MKTIVVIPTIREVSIESFLLKWREEFKDIVLMVIEDNPRKTFALRGENVVHYSWEDIDRELKKDSWIIPRRTDCIRSYGYWKAAQLEADMIITLDDDCYPHPSFPGFVAAHWARLSESDAPAWTSTTEGTAPRGLPYFSLTRKLPVIVNHGLWDKIPDYDSITQLAQQRGQQTHSWVNKTIERGKFFPMCGMNLAFKPTAVPALYFLLMGQGYNYDRFGDIWCGIILKRICDHLGYAINSGEPAVLHDRASSVWANLQKEAPGLPVNEVFWQEIDSIVLTQRTMKDCFAEIAKEIGKASDYWKKVGEAMMIWAQLF